MKTALVGCGKVAALHANALASLPQSEFVAVVDRDPTRAAEFAKRYGTRAFDNVTKAVRSTGAQAVFLCTPHPLHADGAIQAMDAGAHVLVEKPLAASLADCDRMLEAASLNAVQLGVVSQRRLYEPVLRMKEAIDAGKIGKPLLATVSMFSWRDEAYYRSDPWRGKWETEGGGVLVNQSPHHLDLLLWFMGQVKEVSGVTANLNHPYIEVEDTAVATLRFQGGGVASIVVSLSQKPGLYTKIHVHGSNGASVGAETDSGATFIAGVSGAAAPALNDVWTIPGEEHLLREFRSADQDRFQLESNPAERYHAQEISNFLDALAENRQVPVPGSAGRKVVELFDAIYRASRESRVITIPEGDRH